MALNRPPIFLEEKDAFQEKFVLLICPSTVQTTFLDPFQGLVMAFLQALDT